MITILEEDTPKITSCIEQTIKMLSNGTKKAESEITIGEDTTIANVKGYWVGDLIRIDIKFRK